ncbi:MAG: cardiolipin synthase [Gammaproteobacteria bacterium]|nr:cardiolipin synthase [Gammaproteobacteria bacterium]MDH5801048.1 cardiolipin synthase [Gammaproteobacteria bacterium]
MNSLFATVLVVVWLLGLGYSVNAIMTARTAQGAIAWAVSLVTLPIISLPLYWIFGQRKFYGYVYSRRAGDLKINQIAADLSLKYLNRKATLPDRSAKYQVLEKLASMPFTTMNSVELLIDGEQSFNAIFAAMDKAKDYIVLQFYIVQDGKLGERLKQKLISKAAAGVRIYFLFDGVGSYGLSSAFVSQLTQHGVQIRPFKTLKGPSKRFQINFRNHRKVVIVDGKVAFVGGFNLGDEYLGQSKTLGQWRDTEVMLQGPSVQCVQLAFLEDWYWADGSVPEFNWQAESTRQHHRALIMPTGPADLLDTCGLFFVHVINCARKTLWIISPYFVPDQQVTGALQVAALRGVDVRIMLPEKSDNPLVDLAAMSYMEELMRSGVEFYRYHKGFLHQKVLLVDQEMAVVGTANLDNRSFRLNFELNVVVVEEDFAIRVENMIQDDLKHCRLQQEQDWERRSSLIKFLSKAARLMAPVL